MKYLEWVTEQPSLFNELDKLAPEGIISTLGVEQLDFFYIIQHGTKTMLPTLEGKTTVEVAKMIHTLYMNKWTKLAEIVLNDLPLGFDTSTTNETTNTGNSNKSISTNNVDKASVHNEPELVDVAGEIDSLEETGTNNQTTSTTVQTVNIKSIGIQRVLLENSNITNTICCDIANVLSLSIY